MSRDFTPVNDLASEAEARLSPSMADRLSLILVLVGAAACTMRFALRFPLWPDESLLAINLMRRDLAGVLQPLEYHQVAPPLFLLSEKLLVRVAGFNEWALRLLPFLCSLASLWLFRRLARSLVDRWSYVLAVAVFSVSYPVIRYTAELKPYALDLLLSLILLNLVIGWRARTDKRLVLAGLCGVSLLAFGFSFPSVFLGGGVCVFMAAEALVTRRRALLGHAILVGAGLSAGFLLVYTLHGTHQMSAEAEWMREYWERAFPPLKSPLRLVPWLLGLFTGELMPYPIGGKDFGSIGTFLLCIIALAVLSRAQRADIWILLLAPLGLAFVAATLQRYPFGAPTRCQLYLAPIFCLLAGVGLAAVLQLGRHRDSPKRLRYAICALACVAVASMIRDVSMPAKSTTDMILRDFARTFWKGGDLAGAVNLCLREDLHVTFTPNQDVNQGLLGSYLCNYYIYRAPDRVDPASWNGSGPIQVATFHIDGRFERQRRKAWIEQFQEQTGLRYAGGTLLSVPDVDKRERLKAVCTIEIFRFEPSS